MRRLICTLAFIQLLLISSFCQDSLKAVLVKDIKPISYPYVSENSSWPRHFFALPDRLLFMAGSGFNNYLYDLWSTDGTPEGTVIVKDKNSIYPAYVNTGITLWGDKIIFAGNDGIHGFELWTSDGTNENTGMVKDIKPNNPYSQSVDGSEPNNFKVIGDKVYFTADTNYGRQLFVTDGTDAGTIMLTKTGVGSWNPSGFTELNGKVFFSNSSGYNLTSLWETDGTAEGTKEFMAFADGFVSTLWSIVYKDKLYFSASTNNLGLELWVTAGTAEGTRLFKDIHPTAGRGSYPHGYTIYKDQLYFIADDGIHGNELWCTNGDTTYLVKDVSTGMGAMDYAELNVLNDRLYFGAQQVNGGAAELWISDGTAEGTQQVLAFDSTAVANPTTFTEWNGKIVFTAGQYNKQLWITDGSSVNTRPVFANASWSALQHNYSMINYKGEVYFGANYTDSIGGELYKLTVDSNMIRPVIIQQPLAMNVCTGESAYFEVKVTGKPDFEYQWMKDDVMIENATQASYQIDQTSLEDAGNYRCLIKNSEGEVKTDSASLGVYDLSVDFEVIDSTQADFYYIKFTGNAPVTADYQWNFDQGKIISGSGQGPYRVAWNHSGSRNITLEVRLNTCSSEMSKAAEVIATGVSMKATNLIVSMYPNPVKTDLTIHFNQSGGSKKVTLTDLYGHVIVEKQTGEGSMRLDLSNVAKGVYIIRVQFGLAVINRKIIKVGSSD